MDPRRHPEDRSTSAPAARRGGSTASIPVDRKPRPIPRLDRLDTAGLVAALDSPNGWQRDTAQRLLMHRNDPRGRSSRCAQLAATRPDGRKTRVQAVWTLSTC